MLGSNPGAQAAALICMAKFFFHHLCVNPEPAGFGFLLKAMQYGQNAKKPASHIFQF